MSDLISFMRFISTFSSDPKPNRHFGIELQKILEAESEKKVQLFCEADDVHGLFFFRMLLSRRLGTQTGWVSGLALSLSVQYEFLFIRWVDGFGIHALWIPYELLEDFNEVKTNNDAIRHQLLRSVERKTTGTQGACDVPQILESNDDWLITAVGS